MDGDRFDTLTRAISVTRVGSRRGFLGGLLGGALAMAGLDEARAKRKRKRSTPRWPRGCPKAKVTRCLKPAQAKFLRATRPCRKTCEAKPKGRACKACICPHAVRLANAAQACTARLCPGGSSPVGAASQGVGRARMRAAALPSCQSGPLKTCNGRTERNYVLCLVGAGGACIGSGGVGCVVALGSCLAYFVTGMSDCNEDFGCSPGICLPSNVCCPSGFHTPCGDVCCPSHKICNNGACECVPGICSRDCPCPEGETCSASRCCRNEDLMPGGFCCNFGRVRCNGGCCPFGQICGGNGCRCPSGVRQCGKTCCHAGAVGCDGNVCLNQCDLEPWGCGG